MHLILNYSCCGIYSSMTSGIAWLDLLIDGRWLCLWIRNFIGNDEGRPHEVMCTYSTILHVNLGVCGMSKSYSQISNSRQIILCVHPHLRCNKRLFISGIAHEIYQQFGRLLFYYNGNHTAWVSYQIRKIVGCACAGNAGNVFPATDFEENC